jgi:hypothetical protein
MEEQPKKFPNQIGNWFNAGMQIPEEKIREAMSKTTSNMKAAEYLEVSYPTYKKYAKGYVDMETGKTLFALHQNRAMKGVVGRTWVGGKLRWNWDNILQENQRSNPERIAKLKEKLLEHEKLEQRCYRCTFNEKRVEDSKSPLMLNFKNGDKTDWRIQNLEFVCYNCAYLHCLDFYEDSVIEKVETLSMIAPQGKSERKQFYQLDDFYLDHIKKLGLQDTINKESAVKAEEEKSGYLDEDDGLLDFVDYV